MTTSLEKAFHQASRLPEPAREQLAEQLLEDIEGEHLWDETLGKSQNLLDTLAGKAREARKGGKTIPKGFDEL